MASPKMRYRQRNGLGKHQSIDLWLRRTVTSIQMITINMHYFWWMLRPAYAVEYDYLPAHQSSRSLMTKKIEGLFFSGQINGTIGYEEVAAQVLLSWCVLYVSACF